MPLTKKLKIYPRACQSLYKNFRKVIGFVAQSHEYHKRGNELEPLGIDLDTLAPIEGIIQATYIAIGVTIDGAADGSSEWDWAGTLFGLYGDTDGTDDAFLKVAEELRETYRNEMLGLSGLDKACKWLSRARSN